MAGVVASFIGADIYTQAVARDIGDAAIDILVNGLPSIQHLTAIRTRLQEVRSAVDAADVDGRLPDFDSLDASQEALVQELIEYNQGPTYRGEELLSDQVGNDVGRLGTVLDNLKTAARRGDHQKVVNLINVQVRPIIRITDDAVVRTIDRNIRGATESAQRIQSRRNNELALVAGMDALSVILAIVATLFAVRAARERDRVLLERSRESEIRAHELELFSGRVAHDLLSPLQAAQMALDISALDAADPKRQRVLQRGRSGVQHVKQIVDALLAFARAGARPEAAGRADLQPILGEAVTEIEAEAAAAGITVYVEPCPPLAVACNAGVLLSVLSNLLRNAVRHMGDVPVRRIVVRALDRGAQAEVQVEDTGPGIPLEWRARIFDLYATVPSAGRPGLGLGLATVKRLVDAHGGRVGVESSGRGSRFWFILPKPRAPKPSTQESTAPSHPRPEPQPT
jgi:signal transduction histidine kinase